MKFQAISKKDAEHYLDNNQAVLIDLRTKEEYEEYHLEGAINVPFEQLEEYKSKLKKEYVYIFYCQRGSSSLLAAKKLSKEGYQVYTVIGGIQAWMEHDLK